MNEKRDIPFELELTNGMKALIDAEDYSLVQGHKWRAVKIQNCWYVRTTENKNYKTLHRLLIKAKPGEIVDHANRNGLDNRKSNLRICTHAQNMRNRKEKNSTGYIGVSKVIDRRWKSLTPKYQATLRVNGKSITRGMFKTAKDAALMRDSLAKEHHGEFAVLNFKEGT